MKRERRPNAEVAAMLVLAGAPVARAMELPAPCVAGSCGTNNPSTFASSGSATANVSGSTLTVNQTTDRAVLNWSSFNVSADGRVVFQQPASTSIALNRIFQNDPSKILGSVQANGEIYLVNPNGFVFGQGARVNASGILASTLNISDSVFNSGLLSPELVQSVTPALQSDGRVGVLNADGTPRLGPDGKPVQIQLLVEQGARLTTSGTGGRILLAGQNVTNAGELAAPDGQVVMAAGEKIYLQASKDPGLRGLLVEVDAGGHAWNQLTGQISTGHGNTTMVGLAVNQQGRISATTSIAANGSVRLLARDSVVGSEALGVVATRGGSLELGAGSSIAITPDLADTATAVDDQEQLKSTVLLNGREIFLRSGSSITAASGKLDVQAQVNPAEPALNPASDRQSRIRMEAGAQIDLSGSDSTASVTRNFVTVELRANELRDSPAQRDGALRGQAVVVDARVDTPFADVTGALAATPRTVAERTGAGGTANFSSDGDIVVDTGARIDVSGGQLNYIGGEARTSSLIASDGRIFDIGSADPSRTYVGIVQPTTRVVHDRWGVVETIASPSFTRYEPGYVSGFSAGTTSFASPAMLLNGTLVGHVVSGPFQRTPSSAVAGGRLIIGASGGGGLVPLDYRAPDTSFALTPRPVVVADTAALPASLALQLPLDYLTNGGFTRTELYSNGTITLPENMPLNLGAGSSLSMRANRVDIFSSITNPGGALSFAADATSSIAGAARATAGVQVGAGVTFDVRGTWTNDSLLPQDMRPTDRIFRDGGSVSLLLDRSLEVAGSNAELTVGAASQFLVSGGGWINGGGTLAGGKGGRVSLLADATGSSLQLDPGIALQGYGVAGALGGSLAITAGRVQIAPSAGTSWYDPARVSFAGTNYLTLAPVLFDGFGFSSFDLIANGQRSLSSDPLPIAVVRDGATVNILPRTIVLAGADLTRPTGGQITGFGSAQLLEETLRPASSLALRALPRNLTQDRVGGLEVESGAVLQAGAKSTFTFASAAGIQFDGTVVAPSGTIRLTEVAPDTSIDNGYDPKQRIELGATANLNAAGTVLLQNVAQPFKVGTVLGGGTVELLADRGDIVTQAGSLIDVSGTQASLDFAQADPGTPYDRKVVGSAGGQITLRAAEGVDLDGSMRAMGGVGETGRAGGGTLSMEMSRGSTATQGSQTPFPGGPRVVSLQGRGQANTATPNGVAVLNAALIEDSGFDALQVKAQDRIDAGPGVDIDLARSVQLDAPVLAMQGGAASITADYIRLGSTLPRDVAAAPTAGFGQLTLNGEFIEVLGSSALQGIASANLFSSGDLRLRGTDRNGGLSVGSLITAGDLNIRASRVYPATATQFLLQSAGQDNTIRFSQVGTSPGTPLSAAGSLRVLADNIVQNGTLLAPFGSIDLTARDSLSFGSGSLTSVSANGSLIPFGRTQNGNQWFYSANSAFPLEQTAVPDRAIRANGDSVSMAAGAVIDVSGGGDLSAIEWIPGTGGSRDALAPGVTAGLYAVVPSLQGQFAPYDPLEFGGSDLRPGDSLYLSVATGGLAAGVYPLLPARYALLPGAYLVSAVPNSTGLASGSLGSLPDGTPVIAGQRTFGSGGVSGDTLFTGYAIRPGSYGRSLAQYSESTASKFFPALALRKDLPRAVLPADAGIFSLGVGSALQALGTVRSAAATGGSAARIDLSADDLQIVNHATTGGSAVQVEAGVLNGWNAGRLVIGGQSSAGGSSIDVKADSVTVGDGVTLRAEEVVLVARDTVALEGSATVATPSADAANFAAPTNVSAVNLTGTGPAGAAFVAVSDRAQLLPERADGDGSGKVALSAGSKLRTHGALTLDAPGGAALLGSLDVRNAAVSIGGGSVLLGNGTVNGDEVAVSASLLQQLQTASALRFAARESIDLAGAITLAGNGAGFNRIDLITPQIRNLTPGASSTFAARSIVLGGGDVPTSAAGGSGSLSLAADNITVGAGNQTINGFASVDLRASGQIAGVDDGAVIAAGDLNLTAARLTSDAGADLDLEARGGTLRVANANGSASTSLPALAPGGSLALRGREIEYSGTAILPSGQLMLQAEQSIRIGADALLDVSGVPVTVAGRTVQSSAGSIELAAGSTVDAAAGSRMLASAKQDADAGAIRISAQDAVNVASTLRAGTDSGRGGIFELDAGRLVGGDALNATLESGGFRERRSVHVDSGDLGFAAGTNATARVLEYSTDAGSVNIAGNLTAISTAVGRGAIRVSGGTGVTLAGGGTLVADGGAASQRGGSILLGTSNGAVNLNAGSRISATGLEQTGELRIRAPGTGSDVAIGTFAANLDNVGAVVVEPVRTFDVADQIGVTEFAGIRSSIASYSATAIPAITARLGAGLGTRFSVQTGVELRHDGDLTINADPADVIDLAGWRFGGQPVALAIRASGNLTLNGGLSDGVRNIGFGDPQPLELLTGKSAGFTLVAGANLAGADPLAVTPGDAALTLAAGSVVRTGTGDIQAVAAGDIVFGRDPDLFLPSARLWTAGVAGNPTVTVSASRASFPTTGGDVRLLAGRDIIGAPVTQSPTDWMPRLGTRDGATNAQSTLWGIDLGRFAWNAGTLGGGDFEARAGRNVFDLSVAAADSAVERVSNSLNRFGGGGLSLLAGGDVGAGMFYLGRGAADIFASGSILRYTSVPEELALAPVLMLGSGQFRVNATRDVALETVLAPNALGQPNVPVRLLNYFFNYEGDSGLSVRSNGGSVRLGTTTERLSQRLGFETLSLTSGLVPTVLPPSLRVNALGGDILIDDSLTLFPSDAARLELFATRDIGSENLGVLTMSDASASSMPTPLAPLAAVGNDINRTSAAVRHLNDAAPVLLTAGRDIHDLLVLVAKAAQLRAVRDVSNTTLDAQNLHTADMTLISAGRDVIFDPTALTGFINVSGPGRLDVLAGRNLDLGFSQGVTTVGSVANPAIPFADGADINMIAGLTKQLNDEGFLTSIIVPSSDYRTLLVAYVESQLERSGLSFDEAKALFTAADIDLRRPLLLEVFFRELVKSGREANADPSTKFARGYAAIDALLPGNRPTADGPPNPYGGDLSLALSRIYTLGGGDISLLAPGGLLNVGLATPPANLGAVRAPSELGIVTQRAGNVSVFTNNDVLVNQSRLFTLLGGNIAVWSTLGNIDAGRGAKSAISAPAPRVVVDASGRVSVDFAGAVAGSGIRTILTGENVRPGDVDLIAPAGFVNAGDAGIGSSGNLNVAAQQVVGLDNIQVGGVSTGVPPETSGLGASLSGASATAAGANSAANGAIESGSSTQEATKSLADTALGWLDVFVEGFGTEVCKSTDEECLLRNRKQSETK